jgi:tetratricopeptide (TPR) repeat protein
MARRTIASTRWAAFTVVTVCVLSLAACASRGGGSASGGSTRGGTLTSVQLFETGQYAAALEQSTREADKLNGAAKNEAMLIAGLSAQALNKNAEAVRWLKPISEGHDPMVVGRANASLGLIAQERGEHEEAARNLLIAGEKLQGDDAARASMYAGDSLTAMGKKDDAAKAYARAQEQVANDGGLRIMIGDRLRGVVPTRIATAAPTPVPAASLTVQVGAWSNLSTAQSQARKVASKGQVRIVPILKDGKRLYAVRVGRFSSREAAEQVKGVIGGAAVVTVASGE